MLLVHLRIKMLAIEAVKISVQPVHPLPIDDLKHYAARKHRHCRLPGKPRVSKLESTISSSEGDVF
jgi:hypothetical protein